MNFHHVWGKLCAVHMVNGILYKEYTRIIADVILRTSSINLNIPIGCSKLISDSPIDVYTTDVIIMFQYTPAETIIESSIVWRLSLQFEDYHSRPC